MDKNLTVYPIPAGDELHVFSAADIHGIKIMDMKGNILYNRIATANNKNIINIKQLPAATYIVEVCFDNNKKERTIFVKL